MHCTNEQLCWCIWPTFPLNFLCNFHRRCLSTLSIPWCKKSQNGQKLKSSGSCLKAILVIFGRRALIFNNVCLKALGKNEKWHHFCAHVQWWSTWRRKNVEKGHLAPSNLTFLLFAIDTNGFCRMKEERLTYKFASDFFKFCLGT